jgi:hypothetical protein
MFTRAGRPSVIAGTHMTHVKRLGNAVLKWLPSLQACD